MPDATTDVTPPDGLTEKALFYWHYFAPVQVKRGLMTVTGRFLLRRYCQLLDLFDRVQKESETSEVLILNSIVDSAGRETIKAENNPLGSRLVQLSQQLRSLETDLLLSPAAAIRMPARADGDGDEVDEWDGKPPRRLKAVK